MNVFGVLTLYALSLTSAGSMTWQEQQVNLRSFDYIWSTVREKHWDPGLGGIDWEAVRDELRPKVEKASSTAEARAVMSDMVSRLGTSHFAIIPARLYSEIEGPVDDPVGGKSGEGITGIDTRVIGGRALVTSVEPESPAAKGGVKPGWEILRAGEKDLAPMIEKLTQEFGETAWLDSILAGAVKSKLGGRVGDDVTVVFLDGEDRKVEKEIPLAAQKGPTYRLGHLPPLRAWIETRRLEGDVGYISFNVFLDPVRIMPAYNEAMESFLDAKGVIIDVRGNGGGLGGMVIGMVGWLVDEKVQLGTLTMRDTELKLITNPRPKTYPGRVAVLVDGLSASASEFFSGGLKDIGRARIFGSRTAGAALPSAFERLPNGDGFQYVVGNYVSAGGAVLEGVGVTPHETVRPTREALLEGRDLALEAAIAWIEGEE